MPQSGYTAGQMVLSFLGMVAVVVLAYYCTKLLASRSSRVAQGKAIRVLEHLSFSKDKMICLVEVCGKVHLVVITDGGATLLDTFSPEEVLPYMDKPGGQVQMLSSLQKGVSSLFNKNKGADDAESGAEDAESDFKTVYWQRKMKNGPKTEKRDPPQGGEDEE